MAASDGTTGGGLILMGNWRFGWDGYGFVGAGEKGEADAETARSVSFRLLVGPVDVLKPVESSDMDIVSGCLVKCLME